MNELDRMAVKAAVLKILNDRVAAAFKTAKMELAALLGPEGRKNAVLDGHKLASLSVSKGGRVTVNEALLTRWVKEHYPTEIETVEKIRPAFLDQIKRTSEEAGEPCTPMGDLDIPGVDIGEPYPLVRKTPGADEIVERLWAEHKISLDGVMEIE